MNTASTQGQNSSRAGGFPCPHCKNPVHFPLEALFAQPSIFCSSCGLELQIDPQGSAAALDALHRYFAGMNAAQNMLDETQGK